MNSPYPRIRSIIRYSVLRETPRSLGEIEECPFYMGGDQFEYWKHTELTVDVVPGRGGGFSLESPRGFRFLIRSRVFEDEELAELEARGVERGA